MASICDSSSLYFWPRRSFRVSRRVKGGRKGAVGGLAISPGGSSGIGCLRDGAGDAGVGGVLASRILKSPSASWSPWLEAGERPICTSSRTVSTLRWTWCRSSLDSCGEADLVVDFSARSERWECAGETVRRVGSGLTSRNKDEGRGLGVWRRLSSPRWSE